MGIPEAVLDSVESCPELTRYVLLSNIIVVGGSSQLPGMKERLFNEIRALAPDDIEVNLKLAEK